MSNLFSKEDLDVVMDGLAKSLDLDSCIAIVGVDLIGDIQDEFENQIKSWINTQ